MNLIKTSVLTAISTIIKVVTALIINKIISVYIGASGLAVIGQLQNFNTIVMTFANGAIAQGVVKYTAEYSDDIEQKSRFFSTAIIITLGCSILTGVLLNQFAPYLSITILKSDEFSSVFIVFGSTIVFFALNTLLMSILNGQKEIKKYIIVNIFSSFSSLILTYFLVVNFSIIGALYALVVNQSVIFFVTLIFVLNSPWYKKKYFTKGIDKVSLLKLSRYSLMAITTALTVPVSHLLIREYIGENLSWDNAGYWQGIWYISSMYLMVVTTSLSVYYLPRLSEINDKGELKREIINGYKIIIPIVSMLAIGIYFFRELAIEIAFTKKFMPMMALFKWQLIGDVIKIISWLLSYLMIAKAMVRLFIYTEVLFSISFVILSIFFLNEFGLVGVTYAFTLNYSIYLLIMIYIFMRNFK